MSFHETRSVGSVHRWFTYIGLLCDAFCGSNEWRRGKDPSCHVRCLSSQVRVRGSCASGRAVARYCSYCWGVPRPAPRSRGLCNLGEASKPAKTRSDDGNLVSWETCYKEESGFERVMEGFWDMAFHIIYV